MPLTFDIDHKKGLVEVRMRGVVTLDDFLAYYEDIALNDALRHAALLDTTGCELALADDDVMTLGAWISAFAEHGPRGPTAIVCVEQHNENVMRRYMTLGGMAWRTRPWRVRMFRTRTWAEKWLAAERERTS